ncbi:hypothetical protein F5Y09DRAFT_202453 [Xylaria sp. FL1042]|nr:hypothetical protein F5Y09DRAFT_202453 [Xylaria sp. FL1042]
MASTDEPPLYRRRFHDAPVPQPRDSHPSPPMTPPELDHNKAFFHGIEEVAKDLDQLVHRLNRRPILQDSLRWHFLDDGQRDGEERERERGRVREWERIEEEEEDGKMRLRREREAPHGPNGPCTHMSMPLQPLEPTPALDSIPELSMPCDPCPSTIPPLCDTLQPPGPIHFDTLVTDAPSDDKFLPKANDHKRPRRATEVRLHKSASNLRMLDLVTGMIENGVQCNVQTSTPPSPAKTASASSAIPASMHRIEPKDSTDSHLLPGRMELEIDMGFSELDEDTLLNDNLALRHVNTPAGIRKFGFLRYRSSSEAAQSCKNMKKSVPRMRRRRRTNTAPTSESSASQPPTTMA